MSASSKMLSSVPDRLDYHEKLIGRFVKLLLHDVLGALNMVTFHHLTGHKTAPSRLEHKQPSRDSNSRKNKNRNQEPFHPKRTHKGSVHPAPSSSGPLPAPGTLAAQNQNHHCPLSMSLADFSGICSLLYPLSQLPTQRFFYQEVIGEKQDKVKRKSIHLLNNQQ